MKPLNVVMGCVVVMGVANAGFAQGDRLPAGRLQGELVEADGQVLVIRALPTTPPRERVLTVPAKFVAGARVLIEGVEGKLADLQPGVPLIFGSVPDPKDSRRAQFMIATNAKGPSGTVARVENGELVMVGWQGDSGTVEEITIRPDAGTQILVGGRSARLEDIRPTMVATVVPLDNARKMIVAMEADGARAAMFVRMEGEELVLEQRLPVVRVALPAEAHVMLDGARAALNDLRPPMDVEVQTRPARGPTPSLTTVIASSPNLTGTITEVNGGRLTLKLRSRGGDAQQVTVTTDEATSVRFIGLANVVKGGTGTVGDLVPGMLVKVSPREGTAKTILATRVPPVPGRQ